ncbi:hypothetical protein BUALT_Bualt19G0071700 [Buddleja alternifolia]|uniref:F-box domain-containing protein n=1 Tax=Buddleja alternifolia TaxID=168488 RepID=A0AAV6W082_9LAMI|nr:hypothetical protein BUALT_Bualt19G0071700 [Buddleja alternifolia]
MMTTLPFDLITIILLMLPTKTLVKFQVVCRAWRNLIRDPIFIKTHFQNWASKGFAYYDQTNDYKIVRIVSRDEDVVEGSVNVNAGSSYQAANSKIEVYSLITNSWKNIEVDYFPWGVIDIRSKAFLNESVHWLVNHRDVDKDVMVILAFHFGNEVFQEISLPNYEDDGDDLMEYIGIIKGNLSLLLFHLIDQVRWEEQCYLWIMKEYGVVGSWTKMYSITVHPRIVAPLMFTINEEIIYENGEEDVVSCHLGRKTITSLGLEEQAHHESAGAGDYYISADQLPITFDHVAAAFSSGSDHGDAISSDMSNERQILEMCINGRMVHSYETVYKGGQKHEFLIDLDLLNLPLLYELYNKCGGTKSTADFYYLLSGYSMEMGVKRIFPNMLDLNMVDLNMVNLVEKYGGIDSGIPIRIWVEEICDPVIVLDTQGNILPSKAQTHLSKEEQLKFLLTDIDFNDTYESIATQEFTKVGEDDAIPEVNDRVHEVDDAEPEVNNAELNDTEPAVIDPVHEVDDAEPEVNAVLEFNTVNNGEVVPASLIQNVTAYDDSEDLRSEFDDSSNADYIQEEESSDDDIFLEKNPSKQSLYKRLRKFIAMNKEASGYQEKDIRVYQAKELRSLLSMCNRYSDVVEDDDLTSLDKSENKYKYRGERRRRHEYFKEGDWNMKGRTLLKGMEVQNFKVYREALRDYYVRMGVDLHFIRNEASRINARLAKTKYIAKRLEKIIRDYPFVSTEQLRNNISRRIGLEVSAAKVEQRMKQIANIVGEDGKEYELLWDYCETVRAKNLGSVILLSGKERIEPPVFDKMYFSLAAMYNVFLVGCRPIIQLDVCFLKTLFGEQLLVAVGKDGDDNMMPITFVVAISELDPYDEHRYCVRHMYENFKNKYKSIEVKSLFWMAVSSANRPNFEMYMEKIERVDPKLDDNTKTASEWLRKLSFQHWCRAFFRTTSKSDVLVNNLNESFNSIILPGRDKAIISMFEWIRTRLMSRIQKRIKGIENYAGVICPNIRKRVTKQKSLARHCWARSVDTLVAMYLLQYLREELMLMIMWMIVSRRKRTLESAEEEANELIETDHETVPNPEIATQASDAPQPTQASQNDPSIQPNVLGNTSRNSRP